MPCNPGRDARCQAGRMLPVPCVTELQTHFPFEPLRAVRRSVLSGRQGLGGWWGGWKLGRRKWDEGLLG
eukprot:772003-Rhodomonas_salina.2